MKKMVLFVMLLLLVGCQSKTSENNSELHSQIKTLNNEVIAYLDELTLKQNKIDELELELKGLYEKIDELESRNNKNNNERLEMSNIIEKQNNELEALKGSSTYKEKADLDTSLNEKDESPVVKASDDASIQYAIEIEGQKLWIDKPEGSIPYIKLHIDDTLIENTSFGTGGSKSIKKISNEDFVISLYERSDKTYTIESIALQTSRYSFGSLLRVGDSVNVLLESRLYQDHPVKLYDDDVYKAYKIRIDEMTTLLIEVKNGIIKHLLLHRETL